MLANWLPNLFYSMRAVGDKCLGTECFGSGLLIVTALCLSSVVAGSFVSLRSGALYEDIGEQLGRGGDPSYQLILQQSDVMGSDTIDFDEIYESKRDGFL